MLSYLLSINVRVCTYVLDEGERAPLYQAPPAKKELEVVEVKEETIKLEKKKKKPRTEVGAFMMY